MLKDSCRAQNSGEAWSNKHAAVVVLYQRNADGKDHLPSKVVFGHFAWRARRALSLLLPLPAAVYQACGPQI
jgi:hypothetical protein